MRAAGALRPCAGGGGGGETTNRSLILFCSATSSNTALRRAFSALFLEIASSFALCDDRDGTMAARSGRCRACTRTQHVGREPGAGEQGEACLDLRFDFKCFLLLGHATVRHLARAALLSDRRRWRAGNERTAGRCARAVRHSTSVAAIRAWAALQQRESARARERTGGHLARIDLNVARALLVHNLSLHDFLRWRVSRARRV